MRKVALVLVLLLALGVGPAFSGNDNGGSNNNQNNSNNTTNNYTTTITSQGGAGGQGGQGGKGGDGGSVLFSGNSSNENKNTNTNMNMNLNENKNTNLNNNTNVQGQGQAQGQKQGQAQGQIQGQSQSNTNTVSNSQGQSQSVENSGNTNQTAGNINIENPRDFLAIPGVGVYTPAMIPGTVADVTKLLFLPVGLKAMSGNDAYVEVKTYNGSIFDRIRLEDLSEFILEEFNSLVKKNWAEASQIRVQVMMKSQSKGVGGSSGANGAMSTSGSTGYGGGVAGLIGYNTSYADPQYVVTFFRIPYVRK